MKISIHMLALNDNPYIWWALKSSYEAVDHISIVEGAITHDIYGNRYHHVPATKDGLSLDNTADEIRRFIKNDDPNHKVHYEQVGFVHSWEDLRNKAHSMHPPDTDIVLLQDGDCLLKPRDILKAKIVLETYPQVFEVANYCHSFIWDFKHVMKTGTPRKDYWRWCFYRYNPTMHFDKERTLSFGDGSTGGQVKIEWIDFLRLHENEYRDKKYIVYSPDLLNVYHFGNVQEKERMEIQLMRKFFSPQNMEINKLELPDRKRETLLNWLQMYHKFYTHVPDTPIETFEIFDGVYPLMPSFESHQYYDKNEEWFRHEKLDGDPSSPFFGQRWWD